jgi:hypothetical protein
LAMEKIPSPLITAKPNAARQITPVSGSSTI